jgi:sugar (pentulose or hexulose) kinase
MAVARAKPEVVAVLDVGKTNVKLLAIAPGGDILSFRSAPNEVRSGEPYPSCDVEHVWRWLLVALADLAERFQIRAIVPTTYGSSAALVAERELVLPVLDYEAEPPPEIARAYAEVAPWFDECCCPILPAGLTLARQLFWQSRAFPEAFARARWILPFPQYWAWRLSGVPASEATSLGAQTQLWNPRERDLSELAKREGWEEKIPPLRYAFDVLGPLQVDLARRTGLDENTPVLCGIHDSNANFARYLAAGFDDFTLISTGTWLITFNPSLQLSGLDPLRDSVSNTDLLGRPVACARFMGGREYAEVAGPDGLAARPGVAEVEALVAAGTMALPSFTDSGGPYPESGRRGRVTGVAGTPEARAALASLYVALMTDVGLDLMRSENPIVIDGSFADNLLFCSLMAALRPGQPVAVSSEREGTALGAGLLWGWSERQAPVALDLHPVAPLEVAGLEAYTERWRAEAEAVGRG